MWYAVAEVDVPLFIEAMKLVWPCEGGVHCPMLGADVTCDMRAHLLAGDRMVDPQTLVDQGVSVSTVIQNPGEWLIALPGSYISGFCTGPVILESIAIAFDDWAGPKRAADLFAKACKCMVEFDADMVVVDEMRCNFGGDKLPEPFPLLFMETIQCLAKLVADIKVSHPPSVEVDTPSKRSRRICTHRASQTSLAYVMSHRQQSPHCLAHFQEIALEAVKDNLHIYLPPDWNLLKLWAGVETEAVDGGGLIKFVTDLWSIFTSHISNISFCHVRRGPNPSSFPGCGDGESRYFGRISRSDRSAT